MTDKRIAIPILLFIGFFIRITLLPFAQVVDADAVTRIFIAERWWDNPTWITEGVWLPFHQYFYGGIIGIFGNTQTIPILISLLLSVLTAIPMYNFVAREFHKKAAFWVTLALLLNPVLFRNSYHTLAGTPFVLLVVLALSYLSKSWEEKKMSSAFLAGIFMTLACGFRYEGWMLFAVFTGYGCIQMRWKETALFWITGMVFPAFWMLGNYAAHQDFFYGLSGAYEWNIIREGVNSYIPRDAVLLRWFFFPASWFFLFSPILVIPLVVALWKAIRLKTLKWRQLRWGLLFLILLVTFIYKSTAGTLLDQHRFSSILIVFSVPFLALVWDLPGNGWKRFTQIGIVSLLPLSFLWMRPDYKSVLSKDSSSYYAVQHFQNISNPGIEAVPRLRNQKIAEIQRAISPNFNDKSGFIIDFIDWESTYYLALNSGLKRDQLFLQDGAKNSKNDPDQIENLVLKYPKGILLFKQGSSMTKTFEFTELNRGKKCAYIGGRKNLKIQLVPLKESGKLKIFAYEYKTETVH